MGKASLRKWALITVGILAVALGVVGIFVPVLPTTPLLLLAAGCFVESSPRLYTWLIRRKWFGKYIQNYREHRAMTWQARLVTLALLWGGIGSTILFAVQALWLRLLLLAIAIGVTVHLFYLKTMTPEMIESRDRIVFSDIQSG